MDTAVRFALVGCGLISAFHLDAICALEDAALAGVYDATPETAERTAKQYGTKAYASLEALYADPSVDAVCITTPSFLHAEQALAAVNAGKHVLIEKPMALTLEGCDAVIRAAKQKGVKVSVVSQLRFTKTIQQVKRALADGILGRIVSADLYMKYYRPQSYYDTGAWRGTWAMDGGGALMNQGLHGVDLMRCLLGPVRAVTAVGGTFVRDIEVEDTVNALMEYRCGAIGVLQASTAAYPGFPRRIELNGEHGCIHLTENRITHWEVEGCPYYDMSPRETADEGFRDPTGIDPSGHVRQIQDFISAIRDDTPLMVPGEEGRATLAVILATYASMAERRTVSPNALEGREA